MSYLQVGKSLTLPCGMTVKNRFFKSAMSETFADNDHQPNALHVNLYRKWANGGAGIVVTGNVMVDHHAMAEPGNVVIEDDRSLPILKKWAEAGTQNNTQLWLQLNHPGKQSPRIFSEQPVAPSAIPISGQNHHAFNQPRELRTAEVKELVAKFVRTAEIAQSAGFTGVQIHGAFGYLVNQFLSCKDNRRTDEYGGSLENRMHFLVEIYEGIRESCGPQFAISLKLSVTDLDLDGFSEADSIQVAKKMAALGIDLIEIAGDNYENSELGFSGYAHMLNQLVNVPIVLSGGFRRVSTMEEALGRNDAALIGICTPMVVIPDLPNQVLNDQYRAFDLPLTIGNKHLDAKLMSAMVTSYCEEQAKRLAENKQPQVYSNGWRALAASVALHGPKGLVPRRRV